MAVDYWKVVKGASLSGVLLCLLFRGTANVVADVDVDKAATYGVSDDLDVEDDAQAKWQNIG